ncbi:hypothetical protein LCGC14_0249090 [marine sediment metagenome]|uniref:Uncharacterized protein n=1 Tax=marine sediment metagenome TaxID=412755 RepID=A0A0F9WQ88_9ZZZZ
MSKDLWERSFQLLSQAYKLANEDWPQIRKLFWRKTWCACHVCKLVFEDDYPEGKDNVYCPHCGQNLERGLSLKKAKELIGVIIT